MATNGMITAAANTNVTSELIISLPSAIACPHGGRSLPICLPGLRISRLLQGVT